MNEKAQLLALVQSRLPHVRIFWDPPPDDFFDTKPCSLAAANRKDPNKKGGINFTSGFIDPNMETLANDFVAHVGPDVAD